MSRNITSVSGGAPASISIENALVYDSASGQWMPSKLPADVTVNLTNANITTNTNNAYFDVNLINTTLGNFLYAENLVWGNDDSASPSFQHVQMSNNTLSGDFVHLERTAIRGNLYTYKGDDTVSMNNSYAQHVYLGDGDDVIYVDGSLDGLSDEEIANKASAIAGGYVPKVYGDDGFDELNLSGQWTLSLEGTPAATVYTDTGSYTTKSIGYRDVIDYTVVYPSAIGGTVTYPPHTYGDNKVMTPQMQFSNFESFKVLCFTKGCMIDTPNGPVAVENLKPGQMVLTRGGIKPIKWIGNRRLDVVDLGALPKLQPIKVEQGCLGDNLPNRDLWFSPQHRIVVRSAIANRMFGQPEVLVSVKQLLDVNGITVDYSKREVVYYHIMFDEHTTVTCGGIEAEAMYLGDEAIRSLPQDSLNEIFAIFPDLQKMLEDELKVEPILPIIKGREARALAQRHIKNDQPFYMN